jgi:glycerol kinase
MQFQADVLELSIDRPANVETTALGAAYLAGLAVGVYADLDAVKKAHRIARTFVPQMQDAERRAHLSRWNNAVGRARGAVA